MFAESLPLDDHDHALINVFGDAVFTVGGRTRDHFLSLRNSQQLLKKDSETPE